MALSLGLPPAAVNRHRVPTGARTFLPRLATQAAVQPTGVLTWGQTRDASTVFVPHAPRALRRGGPHGPGHYRSLAADAALEVEFNCETLKTAMPANTKNQLRMQLGSNSEPAVVRRPVGGRLAREPHRENQTWRSKIVVSWFIINGETIMAKEQRSNKEKRKPKADKKPAASAAPSPFSSTTATQKSGGGKKK